MMMNIRKKVTQFSYMQLILYYFTCETNFANTKLPSQTTVILKDRVKNI